MKKLLLLFLIILWSGTVFAFPPPMPMAANSGAFTSITASSLAAFTTAAESWIGPSSTTGIYFRGGFVGIGTTSPSYILHVKGTTQIGSGDWPTGSLGTSGQRLGLISDGTVDAIFSAINMSNSIAVNKGGYLRFGARGTTDTLNAAYVEIAGLRETATSGDFSSYLQFRTMTGGGGTTDVMRMTSTGNVGIGTTAPAAGNKLEVNGFAASFTGILTKAATADLAASDMMGQSHIVTGAYVLSLPTAVVGYNSCFMATTAAVFSLDMVTGTDAFYLNQTALTAGNRVTSDGSIRAEVCVECKIAGFYETYIRKGIFVDGGS